MIINKLTNRQKAIPRFIYKQLTGQILKRSINWFKYDWNVLKTKERNFTAPVLVATITDSCDLRCPSCLYLLEDKTYLSKNFMEYIDFKLVIDRYWEKSEILYLSGGEPLLHPDFWRFATLGNNRGLKVKTSTNGLNISDSVLNKWAIRYILNDINVSVDCWDYESFKRYRGGSLKQYNRLLLGLDYLYEHKPNYSMSFLLSRENVRYVKEMLNFASIYDPSVIHLHNINPHNCSQFRSLVISCEELDYIEKDVIGKNNYNFDIVISHIFDDNSEKFKMKSCVQPWYYLCWNYEGDIAPCCHLVHDKKYGDIIKGKEKLGIFRKIMIMNSGYKDLILPKSCKYCQRRFLGGNYAVFKKKKGRWYR